MFLYVSEISCILKKMIRFELFYCMQQAAPRWFESREARLRRELLEWAEGGGERPSKKSPCAAQAQLARTLAALTRSSADQGEFLSRLRVAAPGWFLAEGEGEGGGRRMGRGARQGATARPKDHAHANPRSADQGLTDGLLLEKLVELAAAGAPRPRLDGEDSEQRALARALSRLTSPTKDTYDPGLRGRLAALAPAWFTTKRGVLLVAPEACAGIPSDEEIERLVGQNRLRHERNFF